MGGVGGGGLRARDRNGDQGGQSGNHRGHSFGDRAYMEAEKAVEGKYAEEADATAGKDALDRGG